MSIDSSPSETPVPLTPSAEAAPPAFVPDEYDPLGPTTPFPRRRVSRMTASRLRAWLMIGGVLWAVGLAGWLILAVQGCESDANGDPPAKKQKGK